ncbi:hypothetical protein D3C87_1859260 [compost metagenome]
MQSTNPMAFMKKNSVPESAEKTQREHEQSSVFAMVCLLTEMTGSTIGAVRLALRCNGAGNLATYFRLDHRPVGAAVRQSDLPAKATSTIASPMNTHSPASWLLQGRRGARTIALAV